MKFWKKSGASVIKSQRNAATMWIACSSASENLKRATKTGWCRRRRATRSRRSWRCAKSRRPALYFYREPARESDQRGGLAIEMKLVNRIRESVKAWRESGHAGITRTTLELIQHWRREGREDRKRLFFAQLEAVETIIF